MQDQVTTKDNAGEYTVAMKQCVCDLLSHNVPSGQIAPVIECVLKMAGKKASDLPSKSTVNDWNIMRLLLSQQQLPEELPNKKNMALLSDETSKISSDISKKILLHITTTM